MSNLTSSSSSGGGKDPNPKDNGIPILIGLALGLIGAWILFIIATSLSLRASGL